MQFHLARVALVYACLIWQSAEAIGNIEEDVLILTDETVNATTGNPEFSTLLASPSKHDCFLTVICLRICRLI